MLYRNCLSIATFAIATVLISPIVLGSLPGASSVYAQAFPGFLPSQAPTTSPQKVTQYDKEKNCASDQHTETTYKTYLTHFASCTTIIGMLNKNSLIISTFAVASAAAILALTCQTKIAMTGNKIVRMTYRNVKRDATKNEKK